MADFILTVSDLEDMDSNSRKSDIAVALRAAADQVEQGDFDEFGSHAVTDQRGILVADVDVEWPKKEFEIVVRFTLEAASEEEASDMVSDAICAGTDIEWEQDSCDEV